MLGLSIETESAHADLYINTCLHRHSLLSSYNTQEVELLRACCSDNCLFGQYRQSRFITKVHDLLGRPSNNATKSIFKLSH